MELELGAKQSSGCDRALALHSLATRLYCVFYLITYKCIPVPTVYLYKGTCGLLLAIHFTIATRGGCNDIFPTTLLVYCSAIYPQGMTFEYGLGGCTCFKLSAVGNYYPNDKLIKIGLEQECPSNFSRAAIYV